MFLFITKCQWNHYVELMLNSERKKRKDCEIGAGRWDSKNREGMEIHENVD